MRTVKRRVECLFLAILMVLATFPLNAVAFDGPSRKWAVIESSNLKVKSKKAMQKAYIVNDKAVYMYQRLNDSDMLLTYCTRSSTKDKFKPKSYMRLNGFGHAQSLDMDSDGYFWSTCHGMGGKHNFGNYITRFKYQEDDAVEYTDLPRWTTKSKRVELATSSDGKYLYIWQGTGDNGNVDGPCGRYAVKDMIRANKGKGSVPLINVDSSSAHAVRRPDGSNQGLEFSNGYAVYIAGSAETSKNSCRWTTPKIWKYTSGKCVKKEMTGLPKQYEIEGIQIRGDYLYVSITAHNSPNEFYIYRVNKDIWN